MKHLNLHLHSTFVYNNLLYVLFFEMDFIYMPIALAFT